MQDYVTNYYQKHTCIEKWLTNMGVCLDNLSLCTMSVDVTKVPDIDKVLFSHKRHNLYTWIPSIVQRMKNGCSLRKTIFPIHHFHQLIIGSLVKYSCDFWKHNYFRNVKLAMQPHIKFVPTGSAVEVVSCVLEGVRDVNTFKMLSHDITKGISEKDKKKISQTLLSAPFTQPTCNHRLHTFLLNTEWKHLLTRNEQLTLAMRELRELPEGANYYDRIDHILWPQGSDTVRTCTSIPITDFDYFERNMYVSMDNLENLDKESILFVKMHKSSGKQYTPTSWQLKQYGQNTTTNRIKKYIKLGLNIDMHNVFINTYAMYPELAEYLIDGNMVMFKTNMKKPTIYHVLEKENDKVLKKLLIKGNVRLDVPGACYKKTYKNVFDFLTDQIINGAKVRKAACARNKLIIMEYIIHNKFGMTFNDIVNEYLNNKN